MQKYTMLKKFCTEINSLNGIPIFIKGGGPDWLRTRDDIKNFLADCVDSPEYADEAEEIKKDSEEWEDIIDNFVFCVKNSSELKAARLFVIRHYNGYNQENFNYYFLIF